MGLTITLIGGSDTVESKNIVVSSASGGTSPVVPGMEYFEQLDDVAGGASIRQIVSLTGSYRKTSGGTTTLYINANAPTSGSRIMTIDWEVSVCRIG